MATVAESLCNWITPSATRRYLQSYWLCKRKPIHKEIYQSHLVSKHCYLKTILSEIHPNPKFEILLWINHLLLHSIKNFILVTCLPWVSAAILELINCQKYCVMGKISCNCQFAAVNFNSVFELYSFNWTSSCWTRILENSKSEYSSIWKIQLQLATYYT